MVDTILSDLFTSFLGVIRIVLLDHCVVAGLSDEETNKMTNDYRFLRYILNDALTTLDEDIDDELTLDGAIDGVCYWLARDNEWRAEFYGEFRDWLRGKAAAREQLKMTDAIIRELVAASR